MMFTRVFILERKFAHAWGDTSSILGGNMPRKALQWHRACYFVFGAQLSLGSHFSLGSQAVIWGGTTPKCPLLAPGLADGILFLIYSNEILGKLSLVFLKNCPYKEVCAVYS